MSFFQRVYDRNYFCFAWHNNSGMSGTACSGLSKRRAEMASWIIDEDPTFEIDIQTLITDFEYMNKLEELIIKEYEDEYTAHKTVEDQLRSIFIDPNAMFALPEDGDIKEKFLFNEPKFEGIKRFYDIGKSFNEEYQYFKPN